jgi:hypothetical protein
MILMSISCQKSTSVQTYSFQLIDAQEDTLGLVTCELPVNFDTTYKWLHRSDANCNVIKYRCHSSENDAVKENGVFAEPHLNDFSPVLCQALAWHKMSSFFI